jgi:hypothetical protein
MGNAPDAARSAKGASWARRPETRAPRHASGASDARRSYVLTRTEQIRRLTSMAAFATFGRGHPAGAVVLTWLGGARR